MDAKDSTPDVIETSNQMCIDSSIPNEAPNISDITQKKNEEFQAEDNEKLQGQSNEDLQAQGNEELQAQGNEDLQAQGNEENIISTRKQNDVNYSEMTALSESNISKENDSDEKLYQTQRTIEPKELNETTENVSRNTPMDQAHQNLPNDKNLNVQMEIEVNRSSPMIESTKLVMETTTDLKTLDNESEIINEYDEAKHMKKYDLYNNPLIELGSRLWPSTLEQQHYTKGCLWSPDGTCLLVPVHLDGMHLVDLPNDLYNCEQISKEYRTNQLPTTVHVKEGGTVYDYTWYPYMNSSDPDTCCWLASRQHEPIHMWDAYTGELRCTYRGYDAVDEIEAAISLLFSESGEKIFGGYKKSIKIFDTAVPGRDYASVPVKQTVSCMAVTNDSNRCVTTGSWNSFIYHYDLRAIKLGPLFALSGHSAGITWLRYMEDQSSEWHLLSGARKDNKILQWDMRNYKKPSKIYERNVSTNQRIYFDVDPFYNKWLISGDTEGYLNVWNLHNTTESSKLQVPLHSDCCNGANFHPTLPILASTSGQYHFIETTIPDDQEIAPQESNANVDSTKSFDYENCLLLTWFGISY